MEQVSAERGVSRVPVITTPCDSEATVRATEKPREGKVPKGVTSSLERAESSESEPRSLGASFDIETQMMGGRFP